MKVPVLDLKAEYAELRDEILPALDRVCQNSSFVLGEEVEAFEREFADFCGTKHCVGLSTGTAALHLGLLALGVQVDDEVITSPNTFLATAEAITYCGAVPVFVDIDPPPHTSRPRWVEGSHTAAHARHPAGSPLGPSRGHGRDPRNWSPPQHTN